MKRLNEKTNQPFKRGDIREDGFVFYNYTARLKTNGFFIERWLSPKKSEKAKANDSKLKREAYKRKSNRVGPGVSSMTAAQQALVHDLQRMSAEAHVLNFRDIVSDLDDHYFALDRDLEAIRACIKAAGPLNFDVQKAFKEIVEA